MTVISARAPVDGSKKIVALEGVRGIAIVAVMCTHFERFLPAVGALSSLKAWLAYGWVGVDLFFVLSGFLITGILVETREAPNFFSSFYLRRTLRIFPIYYLTLIAVFTAAAHFPAGLDRVPASGERWLYFVYLANWIAVWKHAWPANVVGHFWSLGVEEQFYIVWPLVVIGLTRRALFRVAVGVAVAALIVRIVWVSVAGPSDGITLATTSRLDSLLCGAIASFLFARIKARRRQPSVRWFVVVPLALFTLGVVASRGAHAFVQSVGFSLLAVGFGALVLELALRDGSTDPLARFFALPGLTRVGRYSYGMYVYHVPILGACELVVLHRVPAELARQPFFALAYVAFLGVLTFAVAAVSFEVVERRILGLKRFFEPRTGELARTVA
ncbi:MAG: acyltransferase [Vulcanimicrobiaceae bacterium]